MVPRQMLCDAQFKVIVDAIRNLKEPPNGPQAVARRLGVRPVDRVRFRLAGRSA